MQAVLVHEPKEKRCCQSEGDYPKPGNDVTFMHTDLLLFWSFLFCLFLEHVREKLFEGLLTLFRN